MHKKIYKIGIDARLWNETGVGRYIRNLVAELAQQDKEHTYVLFVLAKDKEAIRTYVPYSNFAIRVANYSWHSLSEQLFFPWQLYREQLDLMHFPYFAMPLLYRKKFTVTIHDLIINHFATGRASTKFVGVYWLKLLAYRVVMMLSAVGAQKIITVSEATKKEIIEHLHVGGKKIVVTYEGADEKITSEVIGKFPLKNPYFLYVGNAYPHKNLEKLLEGFAAFKKSDKKNTKLICVGKKDYFYLRFEALVREFGLTDQVLFEHSASDEVLATLYKNAEALVMPSLMEGFGLPGLEAMTHQCLVVASDISSLREVYAHAAIYFDPKDIQAIAKSLENVQNMTKHEKQDLQKRGIEQVKKYSWKDMTAQTLVVYNSILK